jgi:hypothetical protein
VANGYISVSAAVSDGAYREGETWGLEALSAMPAGLDELGIQDILRVEMYPTQAMVEWATQQLL